MRKLTRRTSLGFSVVEFAEEVLGLPMLPWQRWLLIHALELRPDNSLRFRNVVVLVARQNGKSTLSQVLALWFMYVYDYRLILGTAQNLDIAEEVWQGAVDLVTETDDDDRPVRPDLFNLHERVVMVNGKKSLELKTGQRYKVKAANRRAGRGFSGDLILLDELREHQSWDAWGAVTKTTMAREQAQVWALSNAGDASSIVLRYLRKMAHAAIGDPDGLNAVDGGSLAVEVDPDDEDLELDADDDTLAIFEWSAAPDCAVGDRDGWAQANPALGHMIAERTVASACRTDPEWVFRTEVLCQWTDGSLEGPFPSGAWGECLDQASAISDDSLIVWGVDTSWDRSTTYVVAAGFRSDGLPHIEVIAFRAGLEWVIPWLKDAAHPERADRPVVLQTVGAPVSSLAPDLVEAGLSIIECKGPDLGQACGSFYDLVRNAGLRHLSQPTLDIAAGTAITRPSSDAWLWDRKKSPTDIAPLVAATEAVWGLGQPVSKPFVSAYADHGVEVI